MMAGVSPAALDDHRRCVISGGKVSAPATVAIGWPA